MQLSLIIPVYKVEKYIEQCLKSIAVQLPVEGVEVIIVDDGSPDRSMEIVENFLSQQSDIVKNTFRIVCQENKGLSGARNTGILQAKGSYLAFLDSDDFLQENYFSSLFAIISQQQPDVIEFSAQRVTDKGEFFPFLKSFRYLGIQVLDDKIWCELSNRSAWFAWLRVYKKTLFDNIIYPERINFEDAYTTPYVYMKAKNIHFLDSILISYRVNPNSITTTKSQKNIEDLGGSVLKMIAHLDVQPILSASIIALSQNYIMDSLDVEGVIKAHRRWSELRKKITAQRYFDTDYLMNRGNKLFFMFGISFLFMCKILKK
jgi:glycosyltransferase involved in cell wall biosynthesis